MHESTTVKGAARPIVRPRFAEGAQVAEWLSPTRRSKLLQQVLIQIFLLFMLLVVVFPVLWIVSMAVDPRGVARPTDLNLFPANATLDAFNRLLTQPFSNVLPIYFGDMLMNSLFVALGTSLASVIIGTSAAYAFSRFKFVGRQAGMLVFIVLLMIPGTGALLPLFIMFNSVQVNYGVAAFGPAFFGGGAIAVLVWASYSIVRGLIIYNPERPFNLPVRVVTGGVVAAALAVIALTFYVLFQRSPLYNQVIDVPTAAAARPLNTAKDDYTKKVDSAANFQGTVARAERSASAAAAVAGEFKTFNDQAAASSDLAGLLASEIEKRQAGERPDSDTILQAALAAQTALQAEGRDAALAILSEGLTTAETGAADAQTTLEQRRAELVNRQQAVVDAETALNEARQQYDAAVSKITSIRTDAMVGVLPYILLAWIGALIAAGVIWYIVYALRSAVYPRQLVNWMAIALAVGLMLVLGIQTLQWRLSLPGASGTQTLRQTLLGLALAFASGTLPFTIWNLKGFFDTVPKDIEEAALIDGAGVFSTFFRVMVPLSLPAFAVTILVSFMTGWSEFILSWVFMIGKTENYTLAMGLATMVNGANAPPPDMQKFAAMAILFSLPILILFFAFQRFLVSGLTVGGVK